MCERNFALEFAQDCYKQYMEGPKPPHCSMCPNADIGEYFLGPNANPVCPLCMDFMTKEIKDDN